MFLDVTHQHSDIKWVPQSRSPKRNSRGSRPAPRKCQYAHRQPTPDPSFNIRSSSYIYILFFVIFFLPYWGVLDFVHLFCCWCHVAFPCSHVVVSFVFACCLRLLYLILGSCTVVSACVAFTSSSVSVLQIHSVCCNSCSFDALGGAAASVCILPTRLGFMPLLRLAGCPLRMHRGQPALGRHWPVSILVETSGFWLLLQREQTHLQASMSVSAKGISRRSAPGQVCGLALLARLTCPHLDGRPPIAVGRVSSPRGVAQCLAPRINPGHAKWA